MTPRVAALWREAAEHLRTIGTLDETRRRVQLELADITRQLVAAGVKPDPDTRVATDHGTVQLAPGPVTRRRTVDTLWLDTHFEDLPPEVRELCTVEDTLTVDMAAVDFDDVQVLEGIADRAGGRRVVRRRWPTVRDLEHRLPREVASVAVVGQERGDPFLVLDAGVVKVASA